MSFYFLRERRGDALLSMILAGLLLVTIFQYIFSLVSEAEKNFSQKIVIEQMTMVGKAVKGYMEANNGSLVKDTAILTTPGTSKVLNLSDAATKTLLLPYFPAGMQTANLPEKNIWGDLYRVVFVRTADPGGNTNLDTITGYLYTVPGATSKQNRTAGQKAGDKFLKLEQKRIATRGGVLFGWTQTAGTLEGLSWKVSGIPGLLPGYLGYIIGFGEKAESLTALQRFDSGDPELNRMHTNIDMNKFDVDNVSSIRFQPSTASLTTWQTDCANNQRTHDDGSIETGVNNVGRVFFSSLGNSGNESIGNTTLAICREVAGARGLAFIGDSQTEDSVKYVMAVSDGEKVPKPVCAGNIAFGNPSGGITSDGDTMYNGIFQPRVFVLPQVLSSGVQSFAMGTVKTWAIDNGNDWTIRVNVLTKNGSVDVWHGSSPDAPAGISMATGANPMYKADVPASNLRVVVMGICSAKTAAF